MKLTTTLILLIFSGILLILINSCRKEDNHNTITDIDGNTYNTVKIGTQEWMAENLKTTKFNDGTDIPLINTKMKQDTVTTPGYCWYDNDESKCKNPYGALYNWYAVNSGKLCPPGWHVPSDAEWATLTDYLGGNNIAGKKLKETGFSAVFAGIFYKTSLSSFYFLGGESYWWTITLSNDGFHPWSRVIGYYSNTGHCSDYNKTSGLSVRCIRD